MSSINAKVFKSELKSLKDVLGYTFNIPTYQRPYVWGDEHLKKLIHDFYKAYQIDKDQPYYISTLITKDNGKEGKNSELIDGQQRFTTLWLIALVISRLTKNYKSEIEQFLRKDEKLRLSFEIRDEVYDYLTYLLEDDQEKKHKIVKDVESYPYLKNIVKAIKSIDGFIRDTLGDRKSNLTFEEELKNFGDYIFNNVYFIKNTTPENTDLNKLFSTINNSGVQLEQTDIVKANLLKIIRSEKVMYSKIWETCENMNNFFERNARFSFSFSDWSNIDLTKEFEFSASVFKYKSELSNNVKSDSNDFNLFEIEFDEIDEYSFNKKTGEDESKREESEEIYCRSIISFGQLLLHTYRLHLKNEKKEDFRGTFHVNRLIEVFRELEQRNDAEEVKRFFLLLWKVRYLFDKYIIKWVSDTNTKNESLEIVNFRRYEKSYYTRTPYEKSDSLMLQSVLYFTGDYLRQYWLSNYLDYLLYHHNNEIPVSSNHSTYLERLDNIFSIIEDISDKELSWKMMHQMNDFEFDFPFEAYLNQSHGTSFKHYWFYKLEYLLWKIWKNRTDEKFKSYRITSKNSVEHIYPQHPEKASAYQTLNNQSLNSFGNLVLLSVSQNSEYSNKSVEVKKSLFKDKVESYDTLKSFYIFQLAEKEGWTQKQIEKHRDDMIEIIKSHYNKTVA